MKLDKMWSDKEFIESIDSFWRDSEYEHAHRENVSNRIREGISGNKSVLDVGCGSGFFFEFINPNKYTGLDYSMPMLSLFRRKHNIPLIRGSVYNLPFRKNMFDVVICIDVLSHLPSIETPIREMIRVSKSSIFFTLWCTKDATRDISDELTFEGHRELTNKMRYIVYNVDHLTEYYLNELCNYNNIPLRWAAYLIGSFRTVTGSDYTCSMISIKKENNDTTK